MPSACSARALPPQPTPETTELAEAGFQDWASSLPEEEAAGLVDLQVGKEVRWVPGEGWTEVGR